MKARTLGIAPLCLTVCLALAPAAQAREAKSLGSPQVESTEPEPLEEEISGTELPSEEESAEPTEEESETPAFEPEQGAGGTTGEEPAELGEEPEKEPALPPESHRHPHKRGTAHHRQRTKKPGPIGDLQVVAPVRRLPPEKRLPLSEVVVSFKAKRRIDLVLTLIAAHGRRGGSAGKRKVAGPFLLLARRGSNRLHLPSSRRVGPGHYMVEIAQLNGKFTTALPLTVP